MNPVGETFCEAPAPPLPPAEPPQESSAELPVLVIERKSGWRLLDLSELWRFRELMFFLTWRDIKVRYKQTVLGAAWAVLQPLATTIVFTVFLGKMANVPAGQWQDMYPLFVFAGMLPWTFLSTAITSAGQSVVGSQNLVAKVYFPRLIIPIGAIGVCLVDFFIAFGVLIALMLGYGVVPGWNVLLVVPVTLMLAIAAVGVGTLLSALTVAYRDFRYVVPFAVQLWMFATPSIYMEGGNLDDPQLQALLPLNPAFGLITAFRQSMLGDPFDLYAFGVSSAVSLGLLLVGGLYFARIERKFADII